MEIIRPSEYQLISKNPEKVKNSTKNADVIELKYHIRK